jgi:hypothetical protein
MIKSSIFGRSNIHFIHFSGHNYLHFLNQDFAFHINTDKKLREPPFNHDSEPNKLNEVYKLNQIIP